MPQADSEADRPLEQYDDFLTFFRAAIKPREALRLLTRTERLGVRSSGAPVAYEGARGGVGILAELAKSHGWVNGGGDGTALQREGACVSLETGGQLVLRSAPHIDVHGSHTELRDHVKELAPISEQLGVRWLGIGFHPFAKRSDFRFPPSPRSTTVRKYLTGELALDMMLRASSVQAHYDFCSEEDATTKMRVALKLAPLTMAMFANSPWYEGRPCGGKSIRSKVWLDVDADRTGLVPNLWKKNAGFADYVEWALDLPIFAGKIREAGANPGSGQTFRAFWEGGSEGRRATFADWAAHLDTAFPDVRLTTRVEVRGADAQGTALAPALPAFWAGLLCDSQALAACDDLTSDWTVAEVAACRSEVWRTGLDAPFRGEPLHQLAERMIAIAEGGLQRRAFTSPGGDDERVYLGPLKELVARRQSPADVLVDGMETIKDVKAEILRRADLERSP